MNYLISFGRNHSGHNATPLKLKVGRFEISVAGDDSCGVLKDFSRTDLIIFDEAGEQVYEKKNVSLQDVVDAVKWAEAKVEKERQEA